MGRPREHDDRVAARLLDAAERIVDKEGLDALSVRSVAQLGSSTTRAVYSLFDSKAGLLAALGARTFDLLGAGVQAVPRTDNPAADLVDAGIEVFRNLVVTRPGLYMIGVQQTAIDPEVLSQFLPAAQTAFAALEERFHALAQAGRLPRHSTHAAACLFHAMCEGLAALELRHGLNNDNPEGVWRDALSTLIAGMAVAEEHNSATTLHHEGTPVRDDRQLTSPRKD